MVINNFGTIEASKGNHKQALKHYFSALDYNKLTNNKNLRFGIYSNIGVAYDYLGKASEAINQYLIALKIAEELDDKLRIASVYNNMGNVYLDQNDLENSKDNYTKAFKIYSKINDIEGLAMTNNNFGILSDRKNNSEESIKYYQAAQGFYQQMNDDEGVMETNQNLTVVFIRLNKLDTALNYCNTTLKYGLETDNKKIHAGSYYTHGTIYQLKNNLNQAKECYNKCIDISKIDGVKINLSNCYRELASIDNLQKNYKDAFVNYQNYILYRDSLVNEDNSKKILQQQMQYDFDKERNADSIKVAEEKKLTEAKFKQEKTQRYALYGGLALVAVFGIFMFNRFRVTQKQKKIIELKEQETQKQNEIIKTQKHVVEEHQKEILDSIHYAKRIQTALLANKEMVNENIANNFILFEPKDIVSGDFYWATKHNNKFYLAACDSTGHGVPGAFMSLLNMGFLSEAIKEKNIEEPHLVLNYVRERLIHSIGIDGQKDGMDAILICIDSNQAINDFLNIEYAAANNEPILIKNKQIFELPKDKMPVGKGEKNDSFTLHKIALEKDDTLYLYTDGYADQFGGEKGKKFKYKQLNELLLSIHELPMTEQSNVLQDRFSAWKGDLEQVDDVCIIGIKL